jgi:hypothetical protein
MIGQLMKNVVFGDVALWLALTDIPEKGIASIFMEKHPGTGNQREQVAAD